MFPWYDLTPLKGVKALPAAIDISGQRFSRLVANYAVAKTGEARKWHCTCDCGRETFVSTYCLTSKNTKSCGVCVRLGNERARKHGYRPKSGASPTYNSWEGVLKRVDKREEYKHVDIDPRWRSFQSFLDDMGERPEGKTIDRIDNEKGYWKDNCRWATKIEQTRNRRIACFVPFEDKLIPVGEYASLMGMPYRRVWAIFKKNGLLTGGYGK